MKLAFVLFWRQCRRNTSRTLLLFGGMLCAVCLVCGATVGIDSLGRSIAIAADSAAASFVYAAARFVAVVTALFAGLLLRSGFLITFEQRVRMLGQLHALGASRALLRTTVYAEAAAFGGAAFACGLPLALLLLQGLFSLLNRSHAIAARFGTLCVQVRGGTILFCFACCAAAVWVAIQKPLRMVKKIALISILRQTYQAPKQSKHTGWRAAGAFPGQYAVRSLWQRQAVFRPLVWGIAFCTILTCICFAFTTGAPYSV